jgi:hypothetical protein
MRPCPDCPLAQRYGKCGNDPRNPWAAAADFHDLRFTNDESWQEWQTVAQEMIDALKSLLEEA